MSNKYTVYPLFSSSRQRTIYATSARQAIKRYVSFEKMELNTDNIQYRMGHYYDVDGTNIFVKMIG